MILGIGLDIVRIDRIRRILVGAHCDRFVKRVLHPRERDVMLRMDSASRRAEFVAGRWAVKEAFNKALGNCHIPGPSILLAPAETSKVTLTRATGGAGPVYDAAVRRPQLTLELPDELRNALSIHKMHASITHDGEYAAAQVILEARD